MAVAAADRKGTFKVEFLKEVERVAQEKWEQMKIFEVDAPTGGRDKPGQQGTTTLEGPKLTHIFSCRWGLK